jgi:hypothetical protein
MTPASTPTTAARNYPALFLALEDVLDALFEGKAEDEALQSSFDKASEGFGAEKAVLLAIDHHHDGRRRALAYKGLADFEVIACEAGHSVPGVSTSRIREAVERREPVLVQDSGHVAPAKQTGALTSRPYSVLCAPILDVQGDALAVLYLQNDALRSAFDELDWAWMQVYARTLGRAFSGLLAARQ